MAYLDDENALCGMDDLRGDTWPPHVSVGRAGVETLFRMVSCRLDLSDGWFFAGSRGLYPLSGFNCRATLSLDGLVDFFSLASRGGVSALCDVTAAQLQERWSLVNGCHQLQQHQRPRLPYFYYSYTFNVIRTTCLNDTF